MNLKANPKREATGSIIEASLDKGRGYVATILVQNGTLRQGDLILSGQHYGRVKAMFNERNQRIEVAPPSTPVVILGLNGAPQAGEKFKVYTDESEAKEREAYIVPNYVETKLSKEKRIECRGIVRTINQYGVSQRMKLYLIYLLALELENRDSMMKIAKVVGECKDTIEDSKIVVGNKEPAKKLILG